ncbi:MAG: hypothetical protein ABEI74_01555 [Candidatus Pacearchaeota archaeon]
MKISLLAAIEPPKEVKENIRKIRNKFSKRNFSGDMRTMIRI